MLITLADVIIVQIKVGLLCDLHTGMPQNLAQRENIHAIHQATLGKIVPQAVRGVFLVQPTAAQILLEIGLKVADVHMAAVGFDGEEVVAFYIPVFEANPPPQDGFCFGREEYNTIFSTFGRFCSKTDFV